MGDIFLVDCEWREKRFSDFLGSEFSLYLLSRTARACVPL